MGDLIALAVPVAIPLFAVIVYFLIEMWAWFKRQRDANQDIPRRRRDD